MNKIDDMIARQDEIYALKKGNGVPHVHGQDLKRMRIPVPPMEVQQEIVRVLDSFAELEARKEQYAYYRDKLFTFKEKVA